MSVIGCYSSAEQEVNYGQPTSDRELHGSPVIDDGYDSNSYVGYLEHHSLPYSPNHLKIFFDVFVRVQKILQNPTQVPQECLNGRDHCGIVDEAVGYSILTYSCPLR